MKRVRRDQARYTFIAVRSKKVSRHCGLATQSQCSSGGGGNGKCNSNKATLSFTRALSKSLAR